MQSVRNNFSLVFKHLFFLLWVLLSCSAQAEIYKWVDANGKTHFSDKKTDADKAEQVQLKTQNVVHSEAAPKSEDVKETLDAAGSPQQAVSSKKKILMYSAGWCGYCKKARAYFEANNLPFKEYDVENSAKGQRDYKKLGGGGVPIIFVDKHKMVGFSEAQFLSLYQN